MHCMLLIPKTKLNSQLEYGIIIFISVISVILNLCGMIFQTNDTVKSRL